MQGRKDQKGQNPLSLFEVPPKATSSLYVDGIPIDSNEREVCRTPFPFFPFNPLQDIFRPYPGFKAVRLIRKEARNGRQFYFCFVDFDSKISSTIAMETL
jgi:RNA recognition motif-containing protein